MTTTCSAHARIRPSWCGAALLPLLLVLGGVGGCHHPRVRCTENSECRSKERTSFCCQGYCVVPSQVCGFKYLPDDDDTSVQGECVRGATCTTPPDYLTSGGEVADMARPGDMGAADMGAADMAPRAAGVRVSWTISSPYYPFTCIAGDGRRVRLTVSGITGPSVTSCSDGMVTLTDVSPGRHTVRGELLVATGDVWATVQATVDVAADGTGFVSLRFELV